MEAEEILKNNIELINKLNDKFHKCEWRRCASYHSTNAPDFILKLTSGNIQISKDTIWVSGSSGVITKYKPTVEYSGAYKLAVLWGNIHKKIQEPIDNALINIITELDNIK